MSTPDPIPTVPVPEPASPAASPYTAAAAAPAEPAVAAPAVAPAGTPMSQQPYFVANLVVLVLSCLVLIGFWLNNPVVGVLSDSDFPFGAVSAILVVGTFVASLVLRAKTRKAGGKQGLAIAAIIVSSLALVMILASIVIFAFIAIMFVSFFGI